MEAVGLGQTELARRVGVSQPTIFKLLNNQRYSSTHLHKIARELRTTVAYLTGETDDPDSDVPDLPAFSREDIELLQRISVLSERARRGIELMIEELTADTLRTLHAPNLQFRHEGEE
jgi:transcriptional regulator with XRE-family HTH domain